MRLGGVGTSQILLELIYRIRERYKLKIVRFSEYMETAQESYRHIFKELNIPGMEDDKTDVMKLVQEYVSKEKVGQWLPVVPFDDSKNHSDTKYLADTRIGAPAGMSS